MTSRDALSSLRHRRAIGLVVLSAVLPGSAQLVAGHRAAGRWGLRLWAAVLGLLVLGVAGLFLARGWTVQLLLTGWVATSLKVLAWVIFIGWAGLLIDAWRLGRPPELRRKVRLGLTAVCFSLVVAAGLGTTVVASAFTAAELGGTVFAGGGEREQQRGRYNVLLLGVDAAEGRDGLRPDSINVASVDAETGRTVLLGLPRNLQRVQFPDSSPLQELYPDGYHCEDGACMLNGIYTLGQEHADRYDAEVDDPGIEAMKEAISHTLGIRLNYYAMVDMAGFSDLIDAMGGITVTVNKPIPIGGVTTRVSGYIGPGEDLHLDGYHALWLARSRHESSDYERMVRQKCVMNAMVKQLDPVTVATKFVDLSRAGANVVRTDVGADHVAELAELALKAKNLPIETINFVPPMITAAEPDFDLIRSRVSDAIAASRALDDAPAHEAPTGQTNPAPATSEPGPAPSTATAEPSPDTGPSTDAGTDGEGLETPGETDEDDAGDEYGGNPELMGVCSVS